MLPAVSNFKTKAIAALIAASIALPAPAMAWGQREQDTLKGAVGALIIAGIINDAQQRRPRHAAPLVEPQIYHEPRPRHPRRHVEEQPRVSIYSTAAARAFNSYSYGERRLIQRRLAAYGYYRGAADGSFGPGTYSGIVAYARSQGQGEALRSMNQVFSVYDGLIY